VAGLFSCSLLRDAKLSLSCLVFRERKHSDENHAKRGATLHCFDFLNTCVNYSTYTIGSSDFDFFKISIRFKCFWSDLEILRLVYKKAFLK
jgi:hypothetical protein